ncbi:MAG: ribose-5-phosphate isomerase [Candidatus Levybacteria bacterium RBG_13_35_9]|nr:MAG: ribose-5-phosphate isomerase [Candidatus Levybacteria bacterium RBG_13_35_9]
MKVYLASDHAGFELKNKVKDYLISLNYEIEDMGDFAPIPTDDYPDFIAKASEKVSNDPSSRAIVFGKSGAGEEIVANKFKNVRAILGFSNENVVLGRKDNDANVLSLGYEFVDVQKAFELVKLFLETPFSKEERHKRRIEKISKLE